MSYHTSALQFAEALASLRRVRALLVTLIALCLLAQIGAFCFLQFASEGDSTPTNVDEMIVDSAEAPDVALAAPPVKPVYRSAHELAVSEDVYEIMFWILSASKFIAILLAGLLMLTLMFSIKLGLLGQLGAPAGFMAGFYWSLLLVGMLVPWQQITRSEMACGATFNLAQFLDIARDGQTKWGAAQTGRLGYQVFFYARFIAYPAMALLVTLLASMGFARGYRPIRESRRMAAAMGTRPATDVESPTIQL